VANTDATLAEIGRRRGLPAARLSGIRAIRSAPKSSGERHCDSTTTQGTRRPYSLSGALDLCLRGRDFPMML